jgi:hypothetical protein
LLITENKGSRQHKQHPKQDMDHWSLIK